MLLQLLLFAVLLMIPFFTGFIGYVIEKVRRRGRPVSPNVIGLFAAVGSPSVAWGSTGLDSAPFLIRLMEFSAGADVAAMTMITGPLFGLGIWMAVRGYFRYYQTLEDALVG